MVIKWTEADLVAHYARKGIDDVCDAMGKRAQRRQARTEKRRYEHEEQVALVARCREMENQYPELTLLYAVPNGGHRHVAVAAKLKAEGVKAGVPDLFLPVPRNPFHGLYIELKAAWGTVSDSQRRMLRALEKQGYACVVAYGWIAAWEEIEAYLKNAYVVPLSEIFGWAQEDEE
ncbi:VRR-NUC domain-containing protein [Desulfovibrio sp. OttesenSCG-928-A18]|nr:VRR-NUC domain-containing protein [Desulfovibrio sp. OttesenSCG-928-A18]